MSLCNLKNSPMSTNDRAKVQVLTMANMAPHDSAPTAFYLLLFPSSVTLPWPCWPPINQKHHAHSHLPSWFQVPTAWNAFSPDRCMPHSLPSGLGSNISLSVMPSLTTLSLSHTPPQIKHSLVLFCASFFPTGPISI